jgi:hypothetical protein
MNKQLIAAIVGAVVLFTVALVGALAYTGSDSDAGNVHTMPGGQMMTGSMDNDSMMGRMTSNGRTMTGPMHAKSDGQQMPGMSDSSP